MMTGYMLHDSGFKFWLGYENGQFNDPTNNVRERQNYLRKIQFIRAFLCMGNGIVYLII